MATQGTIYNRRDILKAPASASLATISGEKWIRHVAANPNMEIDLLCSEITTALGY